MNIEYNFSSIIDDLISKKIISSESSGIFKFGKCVLVETFTGKVYSYHVVNYETLKSKYLFHSKNKVRKEKYIEISNKIKKLDLYDIDMPFENDDKIDVIFNSILTQYGYCIRNEQIELTKEILEGLRDIKISLCEAGVGIGKTYAYIVAAILDKMKYNKSLVRQEYKFNKDFDSETNMPIIIATSSIELQRAIHEDYIPELSRVLKENKVIKRNISSVIRKGKEHYICDIKFKKYIKTIINNAELLDEISKLEDYKNDLDFLDIDSSVKNKINVPPECNRKCLESKNCKYMRLLRRSMSPEYDIQICNHNYFVADAIHRKQGLSPLLPNYRTLVIDEAHKLSDTLRDMYSTNIERKEIIELSKKIRNKDKKKILDKIINTFEDHNDRFFNLLINQIDKSSLEQDTNRFEIHLKSMEVTCINKIIKDINTLANSNIATEIDILRDLNDLKRRFELYLRSFKVIYWLEYSNCKISSIPKDLNMVVFEDIWDKKIPMVLTSGTLSSNGSFNYIKKELGLDMILSSRIREVKKSSPFDYKNNGMLYIPNKMPYPDKYNLEYIEKLSKEIEKLINATNGHAVVLFTSYKTLSYVKNILSNKIKYPIISMQRNSKMDIKKFRECKNAVLLATGSCWEGIDLKGDILSLLIIAKLPFSVPDPIDKYNCSLYDGFEDYKKAVIIPNMLIKLKQGVGRLIRTETDTGVVAILDSRVGENGNYRNIVFEALHKFKVTSDINHISMFIKDKKNEEYFSCS
ncbi:ATP-dependent DNA helicase DinG [Sedimentibacter acidaminivorans]|uniref:ATP-dependent DNA helicase DinG n=1 Tax=Sedimentibacter acidaminivorans TaxID=913099 RepID=A0ABS4GH84_9FIRM|nr:ATP-dependent DNA helicase [Sedimentibacter acidaminivorans]MBP1927055.1 ATP-dependent DNA helicase DinG [Sedimentibacter acidaminivorans]